MRSVPSSAQIPHPVHGFSPGKQMQISVYKKIHNTWPVSAEAHIGLSHQLANRVDHMEVVPATQVRIFTHGNNTDF